MRTRRPLPDWANLLLKELTRPPYFLDQLINEAKQRKGTAGDAQGDGGETGANAGKYAKSGGSPESKSGDKSHPDGGDLARHVHNHHESRHRSQRIRTVSTVPDGEPGESSTKPRLNAAAGVPRRQDSRLRSREKWDDDAASSSQESPSGANDRRDIIHATSLANVGPSTNWQLVFRKSGFPVSLQKSYGWNIKQAELRHGVMRIQTAKGTYALKRGHLSPEKLRFLEEAFKFVEEQGFHQFAPLYLSRSGNPYVLRQEQTYYATKWIAGQPVNFASLLQIRQVARALAHFHEVSRGFETDVYTPRMEFALDDLLRERTEDLKALLAKAQTRTNPDAFDRALANHAAELRADAEESVRLVESNACLSVLRDSEETPGLCHLDVIPGNFIYTPEQHVVAIDFDMCTYAPRALDLSHLLRRALQQQHWLPDVAYTCFVEYNSAREMGASEYRLVEALLRFPYRAWRVAHSRYRMGAVEGQLEELESAVRELPRRETFLDSFARQIER